MSWFLDGPSHHWKVKGEFAVVGRLDLPIVGKSILLPSELWSEEMLKLKVAGMTCGGCAKSVERAVAGAAPDAKVTVDLQSGEVTIDGTTARQAVVSAIEDAGYDVVGEAA